MSIQILLYYLVVVLASVTAVLGGVSWWTILTRVGRLEIGVSFIPLYIVTVSYLIFILGAFVIEDIIGQHYSTRRYVTIYSNLLIVVVSLVWLVSIRRLRQFVVITFSLFVAMWWLYLGIVSSIV